MIEIAPQVLQHVLTHLPLLLNRDFLLDLFTTTEKTRAKRVGTNQAVPEGQCYIYDGKLLDIEGQLYTAIGVTGLTLSKGEAITIAPLGVAVTPQLSARNSKIVLAPGDIINYQGSEPIATTMGRLYLNYGILVDPFGTLVPYINDDWKIGKIEETIIFEALRTEKISVAQLKQYSRNLHFIGHFTEVAVPTFTERSLTPNPEIIKRRDELFAQYHDELAAGDVVVMSKIEAELIAMDKAALKGDDSTLFYDQSVGKSYGVARKAMYLLGGMVQEFGGKGYGFIENSLEEGWNTNNLPIISNEIRRGSYDRAKETAKGGEETKFLIRVFQNTEVTEEDCGSTSYLAVHLTREVAREFIYRNILVDGRLLTLTADNLEGYIDKIVQVRSPLHCHTKNGYCYTCMGELFRTINQEVLTMVSVNVSKTFTVAALKSMHGNVAKRLTVTSLNKFVV